MIFFIILILLVIVFLAVYLDNKGKAKQFDYKKKEFFMSRAEHECYDALVKAVSEKYYIFPQVHLPSIIDNKVIGQNWSGAFRHINQKSVDFVLCDKSFISPKLVIELDDQTHKRQDRIDRDGEVERILNEAKLPLLRLENHGNFDVADLGERIRKSLEIN